MSGLFAQTAASFLRKYLTQYVENFDAEKLSLSVLQGHIELEDLVLRADAIEIPGDGAPLEIAAGFVGRLRINIPPWKRLTKMPVEVELQNVCVVLRRKVQDYGATKIEKLDEAEKEIMALATAANSEPSMFSRFLTSATSSLLHKVLQNIQVTLLDLHLSYEDSPSEGAATTGGCSVTNVSLTKLIVRSTDSTGRPFEQNQSIKPSDTNYKEVVLTSLRVDMLTGEHAQAYLALGRDVRNSIVRQMRVQRSGDERGEVGPEEIAVSELDLDGGVEKSNGVESEKRTNGADDHKNAGAESVLQSGTAEAAEGSEMGDTFSSAPSDTGFRDGDRVVVVKEGAKRGLEATVTNGNWHGRVKVDLDGMVKSYQPSEMKLVYRPVTLHVGESSAEQEETGERLMWDGEAGTVCTHYTHCTHYTLIHCPRQYSAR
jgi:hypothetical protein